MRVVNVRTEAFTHYIGRPSAQHGGSRLANPYRIGPNGSRAEVLVKYEERVRGSMHLLKLIYDLPETAILGCWCKPAQCHGDIIAAIWKELHTTSK